MNRKTWKAVASVLALAMMVVGAEPLCAQNGMKEKPPMYSYLANWTLPRAQWAERAKEVAADEKVLDKALADGTIVGYGDDENLLHQPEGSTHDNWWSAMSLAGLMNVLDEFYKNGTATSSVLAGATRHWDNIYVSRYYNWRPGSYKGAYTRVAAYTLKPNAPANAIETLSRILVVPLMEKLLADGAIVEYEVDTEAIHTEAPGNFLVVFIAPKADSLDKYDAALRAAQNGNPLGGLTFESMVDMSVHRDFLDRTNATYK